MKKHLFFAFLASMALTSCYCDKVFVGNVTPNDELVHVASARNAHFLTGLGVTKHDVSEYIGNTKDYVIANKQTFGDMLLSNLTFSIYSPSTTKFYVKKDNPNVVVEKKKKGSKAYKGHLK